MTQTEIKDSGRFGICWLEIVLATAKEAADAFEAGDLESLTDTVDYLNGEGYQSEVAYEGDTPKKLTITLPKIVLKFER